MLDPRSDLMPPPSSPTASSVSSSDLDTESTGSFFHDRSTTLGTLMGVNFPALAFRAPSRSHSRRRQLTAVDGGGDVIRGGGGRRNKPKKKKADVNISEEDRPRWRRRRWWRLCRDEEDLRPASLGEYLEVERRFGDVAVFGSGAAAEIEGVMDAPPSNGRVLFAEGRVLPPAEVDGESSEMGGGNICRFYVGSLSAICR
ncbi:hypothetical protein Leryth_011521 [Lithospermum erythrorhizon]|uniref:Uncharacterized protein n=1 Tax=Lithospermum erythrorhizon TaxID=34254 RepID=A0AAV3RUY7_LITER|nr:hypothetical protein Leryth_011521 [Lithospermum erythrorhizon]